MDKIARRGTDLVPDPYGEAVRDSEKNIFVRFIVADSDRERSRAAFQQQSCRTALMPSDIGSDFEDLVSSANVKRRPTKASYDNVEDRRFIRRICIPEVYARAQLLVLDHHTRNVIEGAMKIGQESTKRVNVDRVLAEVNLPAFDLQPMIARVHQVRRDATSKIVESTTAYDAYVHTRQRCERRQHQSRLRIELCLFRMIDDGSERTIEIQQKVPTPMAPHFTLYFIQVRKG